MYCPYKYFRLLYICVQILCHKIYIYIYTIAKIYISLSIEISKENIDLNRKSLSTVQNATYNSVVLYLQFCNYLHINTPLYKLFAMYSYRSLLPVGLMSKTNILSIS